MCSKVRFQFCSFPSHLGAFLNPESTFDFSFPGTPSQQISAAEVCVCYRTAYAVLETEPVHSLGHPAGTYCTSATQGGCEDNEVLKTQTKWLFWAFLFAILTVRGKHIPSMESLGSVARNLCASEQAEHQLKNTPGWRDRETLGGKVSARRGGGCHGDSAHPPGSWEERAF